MEEVQKNSLRQFSDKQFLCKIGCDFLIPPDLFRNTPDCMQVAATRNFVTLVVKAHAQRRRTLVKISSSCPLCARITKICNRLTNCHEIWFC